jgi:hypothetical protein
MNCSFIQSLNIVKVDVSLLLEHAYAIDRRAQRGINTTNIPIYEKKFRKENKMFLLSSYQ